jgi:hypothetical protein
MKLHALLILIIICAIPSVASAECDNNIMEYGEGCYWSSTEGCQEFYCYGTTVCAKDDSICTSYCIDRCSSAGSWVSIGGGKQEKTDMVFDSNPDKCDCHTEVNYRCDNGYYGNGSTCTRCSNMTDAGGTVRYGDSIAGSNTAASSCKIGTEYSFGDATGVYNFQNACYYNL